MRPPGSNPGLAPDRRDLEIERLKRQLEEACVREDKIRSEERERFSVLSAANKRYLDAQYAVGRVLEESRDLPQAAPQVFRVLAERLRWEAGVFWTFEGGALRCREVWRLRGLPPDGVPSGGFEEACRRAAFPRGAGLPGRVWAREEACWVEDVLEEGGYPYGEAAATEGLRCTLAFPIQNGGRLSGVFELLREEKGPVDEEALRVVYLMGQQIGQFVERRRAEEERDRAVEREREARRQVRNVLESIDDAFFAVDRAWRFTYVNHRAEKFWGKPRGDLIGKHMWEQFPQAVNSDSYRELHRAMEERETVGFEALLPVTGFWISSRAYPSADGISIYFRDITESKKAQEALRASEQRYRTLFETIDEGFCVVEVAFDGDGRARDYRFLEVNPAFERHTGLREATGRWMRELVPDHEEHWFEIYGRVAATGEDTRFVGQAKALDDRWFDVYAFRLDDEEGRRVAILFGDITDRRRSEEALRRSEERYRTLTANLPGAVFRATVAGRRPAMEFVSGRIEELTGYPAEGFVADRERNYRDVIHPEDSPGNEREVWHALERQETYSIEYRILHADGGVRWVNERGTGVFSEGGRLLWVDGAIFDVTERRRAEEALRASEERLQLALEAAEMGTFLWHVEEDRTEADARLLALFGLPADGAISLAEALATMIHPDDSAGYAEAVARATDPLGSGELRTEIRVVHAAGAERWLAVTARTLFEGEPRRAARISGVAADITARKRAEEALRENEEWLGIAQRAARSGTWEWDLLTGKIRWSSEHSALFGFDPEEPVTREGWWTAVHPEDLPRIEEAGRRCSEEGEQWPEIEYRIRVAGETRWIDARGRTVRDASGRPVRILGISVDVTGRKQAEEERDRLLAREWVAGAEAAERERISRELHDRVAHSMGVAHQSLQLYEVLVKKDAARAAQRLELAREMTKAALESTRNLSAELRHLEAEDDLEAELRHLLAVSVPPHVAAEIHVEGDEAGVPGYVRGQIFLVLREAVRNAVAHSGCASISVGLDIRPEEIVGRVEDDGRGFDTTGGNESVGLRSMRERAALLDGTLDFGYEPGRGTWVVVAVPLKGDR